MSALGSSSARTASGSNLWSSAITTRSGLLRMALILRLPAMRRPARNGSNVLAVRLGVIVARVGFFGHGARQTVLLDDEVRRLPLDDDLHLALLVARHDEEPRPLGTHMFVLPARELDAVDARGRGALADELEGHRAELRRLFLDRLVHGPEEDLVLGEALLARLRGLVLDAAQ